MAFNTGDVVRLIQPVIQGEVIDTEYDRDSGGLRHLVRYADAEGSMQQRWFLETQLEGGTQ